MNIKTQQSSSKYEVIPEEVAPEATDFEKFKLSLVIPCFNEEETLEGSYKKIITTLQKVKNLEIVFVDDGSDDLSWEIISSLKAKDQRIKAIKFSRNFGQQFAVTAGLEHCSGDCIAIIDADLQDPPRIILKMVALWQKGYYVIYGKRKKRIGESLFKQVTATYFYKILSKLAGDFIPQDTGEFRLIDKKINKYLMDMPENDRFIRGMIAWIGFPRIGIEYIRNKRELGETKYTFKKMVSLAASAIFSFSIKPLRLAIFLGALSTVCAMGIFIYAVSMKIVGSPVPNWPALVLISFFSGVQLLSIGVLGEYVGRAFIQTKQRPKYIIEKIIE